MALLKQKEISELGGKKMVNFTEAEKHTSNDFPTVEEFNTYLEETYNKSYKHFARTRIVQIYGSPTMVSWLQLRIERYNHFIDSFNNKPEIKIIEG